MNQTYWSFVLVVVLKLYGSLCEVVITLLDSDDANLGETCAF